MKKHKNLLWVILVLAGIAIIYAYNEYTRKPADLASITSQGKSDADSLVALYEKNELEANKLYLGKPIDVTGIISEISEQQDTVVNVMLGKEGMHRVSCLLDSKHASVLKQYKAGNHITIRGICTGYLIDVELNRCVVVR